MRSRSLLHELSIAILYSMAGELGYMGGDGDGDQGYGYGYGVRPGIL